MSMNLCVTIHGEVLDLLPQINTMYTNKILNAESDEEKMELFLEYFDHVDPDELKTLKTKFRLILNEDLFELSRI